MLSMTKQLDRTDEKAAFSKRLNELCDDARIPPKGKNRQAIVGKLFGATQKGARKWLEGQGLPHGDKIIKMAKHFGAAVEWLWSGRGPKYMAAQYEQEVYRLAEKLHNDGWRPPPPSQQ